MPPKNQGDRGSLVSDERPGDSLGDPLETASIELESSVGVEASFRCLDLPRKLKMRRGIFGDVCCTLLEVEVSI